MNLWNVLVDHLFVGAVLGPYPQFVHHCLCVMDFAQSVIPLSGILRKNLSATLTKVQDLEQEDIKKLCNTVPYAGNMHDEFKGHLEANDEVNYCLDRPCSVHYM